jgi:ribosomal protein L16 Arg81 hydroxylase
MFFIADWTRHQVFFNMWNDLPTWSEIFEDLENNMIAGRHVRVMNNFGFVTLYGENIPKVLKIKQEIQKLNPTAPCSAHIYISLFSKSETFGRHNDPSDVFFIQALGKTEWVIEDTETNKFVLSPGDMVYIPKHMFHTPFPKSPRVGLSIGFD